MSHYVQIMLLMVNMFVGFGHIPLVYWKYCPMGVVLTNCLTIMCVPSISGFSFCTHYYICMYFPILTFLCVYFIQYSLHYTCFFQGITIPQTHMFHPSVFTFCMVPFGQFLVPPVTFSPGPFLNKYPLTSTLISSICRNM